MRAAARLQLAAIRDAWLAPLVGRIGALERENGDRAGQLAARADVLAAQDGTITERRRRAEAAEGARDALRRQLAAVAVPPVVVVAGPEPPESPPATMPTPATTRGRRARLRRALGR